MLTFECARFITYRSTHLNFALFPIIDAALLHPLRQKSISHNLTTSRGMKDRRLLASKFFLGVVKLWVCVVLSKRYLNSYEDYGFLGLSLSDTKIGGNGTLQRIFNHCVKNSYLHSFLASSSPIFKRTSCLRT